MDIFNFLKDFFTLDTFPLLLMVVLFFMFYYKREIYPTWDKRMKNLKENCENVKNEINELNELNKKLMDTFNKFDELVEKIITDKITSVDTSIFEITKIQENLVQEFSENTKDIKSIKEQLMQFIERLNLIIELLRMLVDKKMEIFNEPNYLHKLYKGEDNDNRRKFDR
jgi:F0F1-type ATP synthase membrane subunit b/b'